MSLAEFLAGPPPAAGAANDTKESGSALPQYAAALAEAGAWPDPRVLTDELLHAAGVQKPFHRKRILKVCVRTVHANSLASPRPHCFSISVSDSLSLSGLSRLCTIFVTAVGWHAGVPGRRRAVVSGCKSTGFLLLFRRCPP